MRRSDALKQLKPGSRNKLRAILSNKEDNAIYELNQLRKRLNKGELKALEVVLNSSAPIKASHRTELFPKAPPFADQLYQLRHITLEEVLNNIESLALDVKDRLIRVSASFHTIDEAYASGDIESCQQHICTSIELDGWSHAILRRITLLREKLPLEKINDKIESYFQLADPRLIVVSSLVHLYASDQNYLSIKKAILNLADRGITNCYSRAMSKLAVQPFAKTQDELSELLSEAAKCSLIDAVILAKFNSHLFKIDNFKVIAEIANKLGRDDLFEKLVATYPTDNPDSEYEFFKQSSTWLEYEPIRQYRVLLDHYYDAANADLDTLPNQFMDLLQYWLGEVTLDALVGNTAFTKHSYPSLAKLELSGRTTRSAIFNYWLHQTEGQSSFDRNNLFSLMGKTFELARTIPTKATRKAAQLATDNLVKLILLLLLARRSKNEHDSFQLRKLLENIAISEYGGSLVRLVEAYEHSHPYVSEYIYDIATEDFLAKLNKLAPHLENIPEIRATLHEWKARFSGDKYFSERARAVRIDHQLNRVRNEIDDHRIYVDPSRFSSWIQDEMMVELTSALTTTGSNSKGISVSCDESVLSFAIKQCYSAFCSNPVFGIASYIGRRIRHGTFHGHLYSSVINQVEKNDKFAKLSDSPQFLTKWDAWKRKYNSAVETIIKDRLHINSKAKPLGLLKPDIYSPIKQEILNAAVKTISTAFAGTTTVAGIEQDIIDYCWRLAEYDLFEVTKHLKAQQTLLKNITFINGELLSTIASDKKRVADGFRRDLEHTIDQKLSVICGWFKRPSIVTPKLSLSLLFNAIAAEIRDTTPSFNPSFNPQEKESSNDDPELDGNAYHIVYDSLAVVIGNAARHGDCSLPIRWNSERKGGKLTVEISSFIRPTDDPPEVSRSIKDRMNAEYGDANLYQGKSGIPKLKLLADSRKDFTLEQYKVSGNEVHVRLTYDLEH